MPIFENDLKLVKIIIGSIKLMRMIGNFFMITDEFSIGRAKLLDLNIKAKSSSNKYVNISKQHTASRFLSKNTKHK